MRQLLYNPKTSTALNILIMLLFVLILLGISPSGWRLSEAAELLEQTAMQAR